MRSYFAGYGLGLATGLALILFWPKAPDPGGVEFAAEGQPERVTVTTRPAADTAADSLRAEISRLQGRLLVLARARRPVITMRDTVINVIEVTEAAAAGRVVSYISHKTFRREYLTATVEATALAPVDSFRLRGAVDFERWHRERMAAEERRRLWTERALWVTALAAVYLAGRK